MTLLLDTHTFLWFLWGDPKLSATATSVICDRVNRKLISPASSWEIAIIVAQASYEQIPIVSADVQFDAYGVTRIW
jgi:PIN domain nuclease of toxin-antitoxin system